MLGSPNSILTAKSGSMRPCFFVSPPFSPVRRLVLEVAPSLTLYPLVRFSLSAQHLAAPGSGFPYCSMAIWPKGEHF